MKLKFLGATGTVTGSRSLVTQGRTNILVDCGLFQGYKNLRLKNWEEFPFPPSDIDAVLLTHAHLDHSGYIPLLVKNGFKGKVFCTSATRDLCTILLPDSGYLQEEEARFANKHGFSKHKPALPLYTQRDAQASLENFVPVNWKDLYSLNADDPESKVEFSFHPAGHLVGAATVAITAKGQTLGFSGDLGRSSDPVTRNPDFNFGVDHLVVESTYGDRRHLESNPKDELGRIILRTLQRRGSILIPSFAVGRAQLILYYLYQLKMEKTIPDIPVYLNSPMAIRANDVFCRHYRETKLTLDQVKAICNVATPVSSVEQSIALNERNDPTVVIAASGMATGGRVLHHLKKFAPDPKNTIVFVGYQAGGTRGALISKGAREIKIHGQYWPVNAEIAQLDSMSAHADRDEILKWIGRPARRPRKVFVTHGEPEAADELRRSIEEELNVAAVVPEFGRIFDLDLG